MGFGLAGDPAVLLVQDASCSGGDEDEISGIDIKGIFSRAQRVFPNAALPVGDAFAVAEVGAGDVGADGAGIADDDADVADGERRSWGSFRRWRTSG